MFLTAIGKWFKDNFLILLLISAGSGMIILAVKSYVGQVQQLAVAKQNLVLQQSQLDELKTDFGKFRDSTEASLKSLAVMREEIAKIAENAKARSQATDKRIEDIKKDVTLTPKQKSDEISRTYAQSLNSTYCLYVPSKCPAPPVEKKP